MESFLKSMLSSSTSLFLILALITVYLYLKYVIYNHWNVKEVPHEQPFIPLGNIPISYFKGQTVHGSILKESYMKFKHHRFHGFYMLCEPVLIINDPELIQCVLVKNFNQFRNRGVFIDEHKDALSASLARMNDDKWKKLRGKLSPCFTPSKLKLMYPLIEDISKQLVNAVDKSLGVSEIIECKDLISRFTIDCISSVFYGFDSNSLEDPNTSFFKYGKTSNYMGRVFLLLSFFLPYLIKFMPVPKKRQKNERFFADIFVNMVDYRRREIISRHDVLNSLIELLDYGRVDEQSRKECKAKNNDKFTMTEAIGQSFVFFAASQASVLLSTLCCLYELALNQDVQEKLYHEIYKIHNTSDGLTYEKLFEMQYLDMVFQETLRKHPGSSILHRICVKDFHVPNSNFKIEKGTRLIIPLSGLHMDPDIYPEPEKFDPGRFKPENKAKRHAYSYLPFGEGPRQCIAKRLGILKSKLALFYLLLNYKFLPCDKTPSTMKYLPDNFFQIPCDVHLKIERRRTSER